MGALIIPLGATFFIDADVLIYSVERVAVYWSLLEPLWHASAAGTIRVAGSDLLVVESLVAPLKRNDAVLLARYESILFSGELLLHPITATILRNAANLRATCGLKTPDAIHAAAAIHARCDGFITNDAAFNRVSQLKVLVLDEILRLP